MPRQERQDKKQKNAKGDNKLTHAHGQSWSRRFGGAQTFGERKGKEEREIGLSGVESSRSSAKSGPLLEEVTLFSWLFLGVLGRTAKVKKNKGRSLFLLREA